ncbi:hypothetical protein HFO87_09250 [Rhizobium leguminosarum]|uniref:hypothetical protein n=1 Tax=Rhizobium leguminosarum TaxID=384 RepID=UPI001C94E3FF|nr:hypothetical protein [Rhizobium leguminosarum]MBY5484657.1 hypothetical protein [Rhizobium leguminosarum]
MLVKPLLILAGMTWCSAVHAQVSCGAQPVDVPPDVQQSFKGDVEGKAQLFTRLLGDVNLAGEVETSRDEIHQKYKNLDQSVIDRYMIWVSCQGIMQDQRLSPAEKTRLWIQVYQELSRPSKTQSRLPATLFNRIEIGRAGETSIDYLESILGTPKTKNGRFATFVSDGYEIIAHYLESDGVNGEQGNLIRLGVRVEDRDEAQFSPIVLDGYWNPEGCRDESGKEICRKDILPLKLADGHRLSEYVNDDMCHPSTEGGPIINKDYSYFCSREGSGSTNFILREFELEVSDERAGSAASLLAHFDDTEAFHMDADVVESLKKEVGINTPDVDTAKVELLELLNRIYMESQVVGFTISVERFEEYYSEY